MSYARWASKEEILERTTKITKDSKIDKSGVVIMYDEDAAYIDTSEIHNLVIGSTGSGKTQTTILPQLYLSIKAGESFIINDVRGEIFEKMSGIAKENGYKVQTINFMDMSLGNNYNPLAFPYKLYKEGNIDLAVEEVENVGYFLVCEPPKPGVDPFWEESAVGLFTGLAFYLFDHAKEDEINLNSINSLCDNLDKIKKEMESMDKTSITYTYLLPILNAPKETCNSIVAVFLQRFRFVVSREAVSKLLCNNNLNLENIKDEKTAIFVMGDGKYSNIIFPMLLDQVYNIIKTKNSVSKRLNIIVDEFDNVKPIKNFINILDYSRSLRIRFTIVIKSYLHLENNYGPINSEFLKMGFGNLIFLTSNDMRTLEMISRDCGSQDGHTPLISLEELKVLKPFEAIILAIRMYPIKTKLLPYFEIGIEDKEPVALKPLEYNEIKLYK